MVLNPLLLSFTSLQCGSNAVLRSSALGHCTGAPSSVFSAESKFWIPQLPPPLYLWFLSTPVTYFILCIASSPFDFPLIHDFHLLVVSPVPKAQPGILSVDIFSLSTSPFLGSSIYITMSATPNKGTQPSRAGMPAFGAFPTHKGPSLLEKSYPGLRRSTPDSEALASSDDELDHSRNAQAVTGLRSSKPARRTSWLNEIPTSNRKPSVTLSGPYSPSASNPNTPSADQGSWTSTASPGLAASSTWSTSGTSYPWGSIWNTDTRKDPPSRLQEVLPSPTAINQPTVKFLAEESPTQSSIRSGTSDPAFPFSIPLQPTPKTYRSQSYSVGQLDSGAVIPTSGPPSTSLETSRGRLGGQYPGLQRRSSRPGTLGERLEAMHEVEDDEENQKDSMDSQVLATTQARIIEKLEKENAELRQAAQGRERVASSSLPTAAGTPGSTSAFRNTRIRGPVLEEAIPANDGQNIANLSQPPTADAPARNISDQTVILSDGSYQTPIETRSHDNHRKAHWQTSLGFGSIIEPPQSRRHSFADVPTRHGSISSNGKSPGLRMLPC